VSGIGPKTAKLIVVQLQGRLAAPTREAAVPAAPDVSDQVVQALVGLGWAERVAIEAVDKVSESASDADRASVGSLLRLTLAALGPAKSGGARG
jgi:Holliday junction DNA helicase RuvA